MKYVESSLFIMLTVQSLISGPTDAVWTPRSAEELSASPFHPSLTNQEVWPIQCCQEQSEPLPSPRAATAFPSLSCSCSFVLSKRASSPKTL